MKKINIKLPAKLNSFVSKTGFKIKKHSPELLIGAGVVGVITSTVMACKATTKLEEVVEPTKEKIEQVNSLLNDEEYRETHLKEGADYTEEDANKDKFIIYTQGGLQVVKLYAPAVILGILSLSAIIGSHVILKKRNVALAAAFQTTHDAFKAYRGRVADKFGEEVEKEIRYNVQTKEIEKKTTLKNGKEKVKKEEIRVVSDVDNYSEYARFFDCGSREWMKDPEANLAFLRAQQNYFNQQLRVKGRIFLNEVYRALDIPETKAGQVVGWVYDPENAIGDNYIDFGFYDVFKENSRDFVNGVADAILLDFNVDGNIWGLMK